MVDAISFGIDLINRGGELFWPFASQMFVQTLVLVAVLFVADLVLRRRVRAAVRYWLWALVLLKLVLPVTLRTPASVAYWVLREPDPAATVSPMPIPESTSTRSLPATSALDPLQAPEPSPPELSGPPVAATERPVPQSPPYRALSPSPAALVAVSTRHEFVRLRGAGWLFLAWCGGSIVLGIVVIRRAARVWGLARQAAPAPRALEVSLEVACALLDRSPARVRLRISDEVGCPAICGFWRPTILVPRRLVGQLSEEQFQLVFAHELLHWKRWDLQLNLLQTLLQIAWFYNPAVWIANANLRRLREEAVDDAVLFACGAPQESYSNTLLDVAAQSLRPVELSLRLIGILESRKALAERIGRMAAGPLPRSARLGLWGFVAVSLVGLALLPMGGSRRAVADKPAIDVPDQAAAESRVAPQAAAMQASVISGRITDESGKPVSDATIQLINVSNHFTQETATNRDGRYRLDRLWFSGEHRLRIFSDRCLGLIDFNTCPRVILDRQQPIVRDFTLKMAHQVRVLALDAGGRPVVGVRLFRAGESNPYQPDTDRTGWMTIGGLVPGDYDFAFRSDRFAPKRLAVKIDASQSVVERILALNAGVSVTGTVLCSDGKPAAGWRVVAQPSWWDFNALPIGERIAKDGSFVLPHIGPGPYDLTISVPGRGNSSRTVTLARDVDLLSKSGSLTLHVDAPSPGSMVMIRGHLRFIGGRPRQAIWINAASTTGGRADGDWLAGTSSNKFEIGPVPRGTYRLFFNSPEIETKVVNAVVAPTADLEVGLQVHGRIVLRGSVRVPGDAGGKPASEFLIRVVKLKNLRGTNDLPNERWRTVYSRLGEFSEEVPGPGIYAVEATAGDFATVRSEPIDTDHLPAQGIAITLSKGARVAGTVVDEEGRPIDGAIVMSLVKAGGQLPLTAADTPDEIGVRTMAGRFQFGGLTPGNDTFQVVHPDYALAIVRNFDVREQGQQLLNVILKRGGTVSGHVHNERGRLMSGAKLEFRRSAFHFSEERFRGAFAKAVTDQNGYYEVHHLPEELIHILRENRGESPGDWHQGVWHRAVLPVNGTTRTVDFGAGPIVSGRLFINGAPLASTKLQLADETHRSDFGATTTTDSTGAFAFSGVPPGKHPLSYSAGTRGRLSDEWIPVRALEIHTAAHDFGRIDHLTGTVTVNVIGRPKDDARVSLSFYHPSLVEFRPAGSGPYPHANGGPFVFKHVAPGKYDIGVSVDGQPPRIQQTLVVSPENLNPTFRVEWPKGTASIRGTIDRNVREMSLRLIELVNHDLRWMGPVRTDDEGHYQLGGIPPGEYELTVVWFRSGARVPATLKQIRLADGETKTLDIKREAIPTAELAKRVLAISVFTPQGMPLPGCDVRLTGPEGEVKANRSEGAHVWFAVPPGSYRLSASFPGAETLTQTVELKPSLKDGPQNIQDQVLNLTLAPVQ